MTASCKELLLFRLGSTCLPHLVSTTLRGYLTDNGPGNKDVAIQQTRAFSAELKALLNWRDSEIGTTSTPFLELPILTGIRCSVS
ncbi:hypothetical protein IW261DRAFT_1465284 [Armillaria novae-zelandiae]|uniref:Uncharacterized protein n=1 Tax=Armillaria novae-zelandiae TaxID=153914 RepID=A0AA39ULL0_9AGAR|nr:hypothetical protein IW261DRAFT_1465284 [Armillaria novae-zelandiae]